MDKIEIHLNSPMSILELQEKLFEWLKKPGICYDYRSSPEAEPSPVGRVLYLDQLILISQSQNPHESDRVTKVKLRVKCTKNRECYAPYSVCPYSILAYRESEMRKKMNYSVKKELEPFVTIE